MSALANLLTEKRVREGLSLRNASLRCGISFSTLSRIERGFKATAKNERILHAWLNGEAPILPPPPMTLRDYFAGQALAGYFANRWTPHMNANCSETAAYCYSVADAMLSERQSNA